MNKLKEKTEFKKNYIRQSFSKVLVKNSTQYESGKIVYEYFKLVVIWDGSSNTEHLPFGVQMKILMMTA